MCEFMPIGPGRYRAETAEMSSKLSGFIMPQQRAHGAAVELEDAEGVTAAQQLERLGVVQRQVEQLEVDALVGFAPS